jgi:CheY-like chemotaxis protein
MVKKINANNLVMLIDDNFIDLKINEKIIKITNTFDEIIMCLSAEEALNYLTAHQANPAALPNFILLDIQMPEMNGFDFLEQYRKLPAAFTDRCKIAMLSSTLDFGDIQRAEANPY